MKTKISNTLTVGFAVFAMLFGAGNLIFPPFLGQHAGKNWFLGFAGFALMDVIFTVIVLCIIARKKSGVDGIVGILGNHLSSIFLIIIYVCLGPLVAIPRTAATTYELSISPLLPGLSLPIFSIIFFAIVMFLCIKPTKIIDIVGTILAPILLITLMALIVMGIVNPLGNITGGEPLMNSISTGISTGYQTMDTMAAITFAILIITQIKGYNLKSKKEERKLMYNSSIVAAFALLLVYGGLAYLGATVSGIYDPSLSRTEVIINLANDILGKPGMIILAVIVTAACLTTAIGLVSSTASYFEKLTKNKIPYKQLVIVTCILSALLCNVGLDNIIALASPILNAFYPILLTLIMLSAIRKRYLSKAGRYGAIIGTTAYATFETITSLFGLNYLTSWMPLSSLGFAWIIPCIIGLILGVITEKVVAFTKAYDLNNYRF